MKQNQTSGLTLVEFSIVLAVAGLFAFVIVNSFTTMNSQLQAPFERGEVETTLQSTFAHVMTVGRMATACSKPSASILQCSVDTHVPPTGVVASVRFILNGTSLQFEESDGTNWILKTSYGNVSGFEICDDAMMTGGTCNIVPTKINTRHTANLAAPFPTPANRYFRFKLTAATAGPTSSAKSVTGNVSSSLQGSFYVRHPTPVTDLVYQWGFND